MLLVVIVLKFIKIMGRPTKYKPEYCQKITQYFDIKPYVKKDKTLKANDLRFLSKFARSIHVTHDTLLEWTKVYPEFSEAFKKAKALQMEHLVTNGLRGLFNTTFAIFAAKNMIGWRDSRDLEITGEVKFTEKERNERMRSIRNIVGATDISEN